jgi:hypothetical protein
VKSNCIREAWREWRKRYRAWKQSGYIHGQEPYFVWRGSRLVPHYLPHALVGQWKRCEHCGGGIEVESFTPHDTSPLKWWQSWRALRFHGEWKRGDAPHV